MNEAGSFPINRFVVPIELRRSCRVEARQKVSPISGLAFSDQVRWTFQRRHDDQRRPKRRSFGFDQRRPRRRFWAANSASATQSATPSAFGAPE